MRKIALSPQRPALLSVVLLSACMLHAAEGDGAPEAEPPNAEAQREAFREFLNCRVVPKLGNPWDYTFEPGKLPKVVWDRPHLVETVIGQVPLAVRWFNGKLEEVSTAAAPGRYAFYAEGKTAQGKVIRRASTVYCRPKSWFGWSERPVARLDFLPVDGIKPSVWDAHEEAIATFAGRLVLQSMLRQQEGAVLLSFLHEMKAAGGRPARTETPIIADHDYHLALKRKLLGLENTYPGLRVPRGATGPAAPVLREGTEEEAGFKAGTAQRIRQVCQEWFRDSGEPFIVLVARRGVVIVHEPFGAWTWGPLTRNSPTEMASLTKLVTGLLFAQFVDQRLVGIDDPVGTYLPDFPVSGDKVMTLRQCFTHTTGLSGHEEWGGLHNPWLENVIANQLDHLPVGKVHEYNGMGYDLAGRVMEVVGGKSIFRLMRENLFDPLGLTHTTLEEDLGFSCFSTAGDFARFGQLLLNQGSYGTLTFFSPATFEKLLPRPLGQYYPPIDKEWGIGLTWMRQTHPEAGRNGVPKDATLLSRNVIGHGSATSAMALPASKSTCVYVLKARRFSSAEASARFWRSD